MAPWLPPLVIGLLLAPGAAPAGESATGRAAEDPDPPAEKAETDRRRPPAGALPGPRLSDRPFRPQSPDPSSPREDRPAGRDCCSMEH